MLKGVGFLVSSAFKKIPKKILEPFRRGFGLVKKAASSFWGGLKGIWGKITGVFKRKIKASIIPLNPKTQAQAKMAVGQTATTATAKAVNQSKLDIREIARDTEKAFASIKKLKGIFSGSKGNMDVAKFFSSFAANAKKASIDVSKDTKKLIKSVRGLYTKGFPRLAKNLGVELPTVLKNLQKKISKNKLNISPKFDKARVKKDVANLERAIKIALKNSGFEKDFKRIGQASIRALNQAFKRGNIEDVKKILGEMAKLGTNFVKEIDKGRNKKAPIINLKERLNKDLQGTKGFKAKFFKTGKGIIEQIQGGLKLGSTKLISSFKGILTNFMKYLPQSPPKLGPLIGLVAAGTKMGFLIASGLAVSKAAIIGVAIMIGAGIMSTLAKTIGFI